jgi:hypothetical protein
MRRFAMNLAIALPIGLLLLGLTAVATHNSEGGSNGFPLTYGSPVTHCPATNPFNGCGFSYSAPAILADYLFWVAIALVVLFVIDLARTRLAQTVSPPAR